MTDCKSDWESLQVTKSQTTSDYMWLQLSDCIWLEIKLRVTASDNREDYRWLPVIAGKTLSEWDEGWTGAYVKTSQASAMEFLMELINSLTISTKMLCHRYSTGF